MSSSPKRCSTPPQVLVAVIRRCRAPVHAAAMYRNTAPADGPGCVPHAVLGQAVERHRVGDGVGDGTSMLISETSRSRPAGSGRRPPERHRAGPAPDAGAVRAAARRPISRIIIFP
jgi:hypothetical protein